MAIHQQIAVTVQELVKRYPNVTHNAVDGISFSVQRGEIFGLLGPNGAGKTTTIGILTTRILPTNGTVSLMQIDVVKDPIGVKQRISVVPQQSNLDQSLQAREILTFHASYHGIPRVEREAKAMLLLQEFGLSNRGKDLVRRYSGGMVQRLLLARALMHTPDVLFLDEPTTSLDPQSRLFLWDRIRELNQQRMTIILTTHDMDEAEQLCDRIAIMDHGKILVMGTPAELKKIIPGGECLELQICIPTNSINSSAVNAQTDPHAYLRTLLSELPGVVKTEVSTKEDMVSARSLLVRLYAEDASALIIPARQALYSLNSEIQSMRVAHTSLEEVFIYLTGRGLR
ncbi:ATP-binding cassette domain-containing protein [Ktedonosporobacter rubrisoli]|uniref:ATP-binding cassette domain-containing protein n=1 Tax=Ktedonosporobacter rubrisoli TaxID=2509675 RepID=A0A4P6JKK2_KTERU|nr:ATP-binding cassette domain-containing protein [Ktedonosporobacter rubrisoli]QBD75717.1 ATP-binding cassette domain-containing protein [Ktedonosporobacter rubrisoli]